MNTTTTTLKEQYEALKQEQPRLRIRNAAEVLGVSELELLELSLEGTVTRLEGDWKELLKEIHKMEKVMALTRNEHAVHERKGVYHNISFMKSHSMGVAVNEDIDLRFLMWDWRYAYAVEMEVRGRQLYSFQFFDSYGEAVHKIYTTPKSEVAAYHDLVEKYRAEDQTTKVFISNRIRPEKTSTPDSEVDVVTFQQEWRDLKDTHDFFGLVHKHKLQRTQALRLAPKGYAYRLENDAVVKMFEAVAASDMPMMIFVSSKGCIQIHTGQINKIVPMQGWFNIMDPDFNLHLKLAGISETWVTKKPTVDGTVTGVEVYDANGNMIVQCFGKRKPGKPELEEWREIVAGLSK
ncbi:MAG: ChuX/HutX family heme-like substrate-binding protein [Bacteroidota bacterium]